MEYPNASLVFGSISLGFIFVGVLMLEKCVMAGGKQLTVPLLTYTINVRFIG